MDSGLRSHELDDTEAKLLSKPRGHESACYIHWYGGEQVVNWISESIPRMSGIGTYVPGFAINSVEIGISSFSSRILLGLNFCVSTNEHSANVMRIAIHRRRKNT